MGRMKEYMMELADSMDKDFNEITQEDMQRDFEMKAQKVWFDSNTSWQEKQNCKEYLRTKKWSEIKFYDAETEAPKFQIGDVMCDGDGIHWLIVKD